MFAARQTHQHCVCHRYGWIQESKEVVISFAIGLFGLGFACSKLLVVVILSAASGATLAACLVIECLMLLFVRVALGNWRLWVPVGDYSSLSIVAHIIEYALMLGRAHRGDPRQPQWARVFAPTVAQKHALDGWRDETTRCCQRKRVRVDFSQARREFDQGVLRYRGVLRGHAAEPPERM